MTGMQRGLVRLTLSTTLCTTEAAFPAWKTTSPTATSTACCRCAHDHGLTSQVFVDDYMYAQAVAHKHTPALLLSQVLFFVPSLRAALLAHTVDPSTEFSLLCELSFFFRMLVNAAGATCRATNLLRTLRQDASAATMGLLEGRGVTNTRQAETGVRDAEVG